MRVNTHVPVCVCVYVLADVLLLSKEEIVVQQMV